MDILKFDDVSPLGIGERDSDRPVAVDFPGVGQTGRGQATACAAGASTATGRGVARTMSPRAGQPVLPPRVDGPARPSQAPSISSLTVDGRPAWSIFDNRGLTRPGPVGLAGQTGSASSTHTPPIEPDPARRWNLNQKIVEQPSTTLDSGIRVNIHPLRHIYNVAVDKRSVAVIQMTLTATNCPATVTLPICVQRKVNGVDCVRDARVDLRWETPRNKTCVSGAASPQIGIIQ